MSGRRAAIGLSLAVWLLPALAWADAGTPVLREARDLVEVTLLAEPMPLRAGPVTFHVLVQSRETGRPQLPANVGLRLMGPEGEEWLVVEPRPGTTGVFQSARVSLPSPGSWQIQVLVRSPEGGEEVFPVGLEVAPARSPLRRYWTFVAATPAALLLLAVHQRRSLAGRRGRSRAAGSLASGERNPE